MLKHSIFREYDIRGIADEELLDADVELLGRALATYIIRHSGRTICLGNDCRLTSARLHQALTKGLLAAGAHVLDIGIVPTPVLYYAAVHFKADGAVMITGSHNPPDCNGFKTVCGVSTLYGQAIQDVYKLIQSNDYESAEGSARSVDAITPYVEEIASQFQFERKVKLVVDAGNGTAGPTVHRVFEKIGIRAKEMFFDMDGNFPNHHPDPTVPANLKHLRDAVRKHNAGLHLKTAGTTWLEEIIGLAEHGGKGLALAKDIYTEALAHVDELCAPYASVIDINRAKLPPTAEVSKWSAAQYVAALRHDPKCKDFNPSLRQLLHVGYKIAAKKGQTYLDLVRECESSIARNVTGNLFDRHIKPLFLD